MASTLKQSFLARSATRPIVSRRSVVVRAQASETSSRRALLGLIATGIAAAGAAALPQEAQAIKIASQNFTGGLVAGGGNSPKSATRASMESYTLEGTKKQGITRKRKDKLLAKAREEAQKAAS